MSYGYAGKGKEQSAAVQSLEGIGKSERRIIGLDDLALQKGPSCIIRTGYDRVCHLSWRSCGDRDTGDNRVPSTIAGTMGFDSEWDQQSLDSLLVQARRPIQEQEAGQSMIEYLVVFMAFIAVVGALGSLLDLFGGDLVIDHALQSASHHLRDVAQGALLDVFLY